MLKARSGQIKRIRPSQNKNASPVRGGWLGQWRYAWNSAVDDMLRQPLASLLTLMVIAISLTLPTLGYLLWKNVDEAASQWYPTPQLTVYLDKNLNESATSNLIGQIQALDGVGDMNYVSRDRALSEFREWSGFGTALDMLEENPLPALMIITPTADFLRSDDFIHLRDAISRLSGVNAVKTDDSWFSRLSALTTLVGRIATALAVLMVLAVFLVIGNSVRLSIFSRRDSISVMKLIGATDGFILRPFLYGGVLFGLLGAMLSLIISQLLVWSFDSAVADATRAFGTQFSLRGLSWEESLLLLVLAAMIGWFAAWLATVRHLYQFTAQ